MLTTRAAVDARPRVTTWREGEPRHHAEPGGGADVRLRRPCPARRAAAAFGSNARNPSLRRAQLSFLGAWTADWAFTVGLAIVAYRDGGVTAVGLVGLLRMAPASVLAPLLSPLGIH